MRPILRQFVRASQGDVDRPFWQSLYKLHGESGGPMVTGWITAFFPYLNGRQAGRATEPSAWLSDGSKRLLKAILEVPEIRSVRSRYGVERRSPGRSADSATARG